MFRVRTVSVVHQRKRDLSVGLTSVIILVVRLIPPRVHRLLNRCVQALLSLVGIGQYTVEA